jgi:hypothetical protein
MSEDDYEGSEFGKGLTYCIALFLCHSDRDWLRQASGLPFRETMMWFNGAGDHLFDLVIPTTLPAELQARLKDWQGKVLSWRLDYGENAATEKDKAWAIDEAKSLLLEIDRWQGIDCIKGGWE